MSMPVQGHGRHCLGEGTCVADDALECAKTDAYGRALRGLNYIFATYGMPAVATLMEQAKRGHLDVSNGAWCPLGLVHGIPFSDTPEVTGDVSEDNSLYCDTVEWRAEHGFSARYDEGEGVYTFLDDAWYRLLGYRRT